MTEEESTRLECSHCDDAEFSYTTFQRQQESSSAKIWIRNIPLSITEFGLRNLFLTIGEPLTVSFNPRGRVAVVEFSSMNEVELAIRDLHQTPPYNLKVTKEVLKSKSNLEGQTPGMREKFSGKVIQLEKTESKSLEENPVGDEKVKEGAKMESKMKDLIRKIGYNPSVKLRQNVTENKTDSKCISMGRGFIYLGNEDHFVGGLENFAFSSKGSKARDGAPLNCANCQNFTTKLCVSCSVPFCSRVCSKSNIPNHGENCMRRNEGERPAKKTNGPMRNLPSKQPFPEVSLESESTVVLASYFTMQTVYVRPHDELWQEKFSSLINGVAEEARNEIGLDHDPELHDLVIARYYEDSCFYRAQVCDVKEEKITVLFVDFGNTQETQPEDLFSLPRRLTTTPGLAVKAQLKGVSEFPTQESVNYLNRLVVESVPLTLKFTDSSEIILIEKETEEEVNRTLFELSQPSWKKDESAFCKSGEVFYLEALKSQNIEIGKSYNLTLSHLDEKEFLESEVFWMVNEETDLFWQASLELSYRITEYCEFLKDDYYLPRTNELCLAKENGKWHRCVNLKSQQTTSCLFFLDDGHSSLINTSDIRKMVQDFTETPSQAICCTLQDGGKLKKEEEFQTKVINYLKSAIGHKFNSVQVLKLMGDAYCLSIPEVSAFLEKIEKSECSSP